MGVLKDLMNDVTLKGCNVAAPTDTTAVASAWVDTAGYNSATAIILTGTLADVDATFTTLVQENDVASDSGAANVADADLIGTETLASFTFALDQGARKIGYKGSKRYVKVSVTPATNASAAPIAVGWLLGHARSNPQVNPPA